MHEICNTIPAALNAEADHRIANNLAMLAGRIRLQAAEARRSKSPLGPAEVSALLEELEPEWRRSQGFTERSQRPARAA